MNPLVGTTWTQLPFGTNPVCSIADDATFNALWQQLAGVYIPAEDYIFKFQGNRSDYLLVGIKAVDEGVFFNVTKQNAIKYMPLDSAYLKLVATKGFSGTITQPYGGAKPSAQVQKKPLAAPILVTGTSPNLPSKTFKDVIAKKIVTPKRKCQKCGSSMTLLFTSFSCDAGCK